MIFFFSARHRTPSSSLSSRTRQSRVRVTISRSRSLRFSTFRSEGRRERARPRETLRNSSVYINVYVCVCVRVASFRAETVFQTRRASRRIPVRNSTRNAISRRRDCSDPDWLSGPRADVPFTAPTPRGYDPTRPHDRRAMNHMPSSRAARATIISNNCITSLSFVSRIHVCRACARAHALSRRPSALGLLASRAVAASRANRARRILLNLSLAFSPSLSLCHANAHARAIARRRRDA